VLAKLGSYAEGVDAAFRALPAIKHAAEYDWEAREREERRERECFGLGDDDADAARAFGCLLELAGANGRDHRYVTDAEWLADRLGQRIAAHVAAEDNRTERTREASSRPGSSGDDTEKEARREQRQRNYEARVGARSRNLDLGAALARWEPKLDTDAVKLLGSLVLIHYGKAAAWAHRLCVEQPTTTNKQGKVTVRYPRGAQGEKEHHGAAMAALMRTRSPEASLAVVLRLLVAQRLADTDGLPGADRQGVYEPRELTGSAVLTKLAKRVAPPSVKQHLAAQEAERAQREQAWQDEQAARLAAGDPIRCECCLRMIESAEQAAEKNGTLVHTGDCEQEWGSAYTDSDDTNDPEEALDEAARPSPSALSTNLDSRRDTDASFNP
jgi:hypothetical protein